MSNSFVVLMTQSVSQEGITFDNMTNYFLRLIYIQYRGNKSQHFY